MQKLMLHLEGSDARCKELVWNALAHRTLSEDHCQRALELLEDLVAKIFSMQNYSLDKTDKSIIETAVRHAPTPPGIDDKNPNAAEIVFRLVSGSEWLLPEVILQAVAKQLGNLEETPLIMRCHDYLPKSVLNICNLVKRPQVEGYHGCYEYFRSSTSVARDSSSLYGCVAGFVEDGDG